MSVLASGIGQGETYFGTSWEPVWGKAWPIMGESFPVKSEWPMPVQIRVICISEEVSRCLLAFYRSLVLLNSILYECMSLNNGERGPTVESVRQSYILIQSTVNILNQLASYCATITSHV
jgi:hypothetical protein